MALDGDRRPGYDRKAQYGLFATYVIAVFGVMVGVLLIFVSIADPSGFSVLRSAVSETTRPISMGLRSLVRGIGNADEVVGAYIKAGSQNAALRRQVDTNRTKLIEADAIRQENIRLKALLKLVNEEQDTVSAGRLISSTSTSNRRVARLDIGSGRGLQPGMPVRAPEGLIGRIITTSPNTADVLLLVDEGNVVPVRRTRDNIPGISRGRNDGTVEIRPLNAERNPFRPGDVLVTSGVGGLYRPNIPVAVVARVAGDVAIALPLANPARVELVAVQAPCRPGIHAGVCARADGSQ
jgi:rod shape-determining protein MreC